MQHATEVIIKKHVQKCISSFSHAADADLIGHLVEALQFRLNKTNPEEIKHIYLKEYEIPQIVLFDILANRFPMVLNGQKAVLHVFMQQCKQAEHITILDLGIGRGLQVIRILKELATNLQLKSVEVVGVEIMKEALDFTSNQLNNLSETLPYKLEFHPIHSSFEQLDWNKVGLLLALPHDFLLVNASLALHHIQLESERSKVFNQLSKLNPNLVTLIEPNVDNFTNDFNQRMLNSYEHFSALFSFIRQLDLTDAEKKSLKQFFSHEFYDNIALPDTHRFEKHQRAEHWLEIAAANGFKPLHNAFETLDLEFPGIHIDKETQPYLNFRFPPTDILAIMALH